VLVIDGGTLVASGTVADIIGSGQSVDFEVDDRVRAESVLRSLSGVLGVSPSERGLLVELDGVRRADIVAALVHAGIGVDAVVPRRRLEDAYLSIVEEGR
jgi:ABC-2 type transport system ATP-binding protein